MAHKVCGVVISCLSVQTRTRTHDKDNKVWAQAKHIHQNAFQGLHNTGLPDAVTSPSMREGFPHRVGKT